METFELWSYDAHGLGNLAEHTYIKCPERNSYFDCWGNHNSPTQGPGILRFSCMALYNVADCYRKPAFKQNDTAGIGVYGINGVCHQTANLFFASSDRVITAQDGVKGYGLSILTYGVHGDVGPLGPLSTPLQATFYDVWKKTIYDPCYQKAFDPGGGASHTLMQKIRDFRQSILKFGSVLDHNEMIHREAALVAKHVLPDLDTDAFKDMHLDFLENKCSAIEKGIKGKDLADKINELLAQFQKNLAGVLGAEAYEQFTGLKADETISLVDPDIASNATSQESLD
jgi:hypothetical protein